MNSRVFWGPKRYAKKNNKWKICNLRPWKVKDMKSWNKNSRFTKTTQKQSVSILMVVLSIFKMTKKIKNLKRNQQKLTTSNQKDYLNQGHFKQFLSKTMIHLFQNIMVAKILDYRFKQFTESTKKTLTLFPVISKVLSLDRNLQKIITYNKKITLIWANLKINKA